MSVIAAVLLGVVATVVVGFMLCTAVVRVRASLTNVAMRKTSQKDAADSERESG